MPQSSFNLNAVYVNCDKYLNLYKNNNRKRIIQHFHLQYFQFDCSAIYCLVRIVVEFSNLLEKM